MTQIRHTDPANRKRGFTLVELMVATGIMVLLVLAVMTMTGNVLTIWGNASGRLSANAEARAALSYLGDDLETLVVRPKNQMWLEVSYDQVVGNTGKLAPNISMVTATENRTRSATDSGNICAVNYQLAFQNPITEDKTGVTPMPIFGLYRTVKNPQDTFNEVLSVPFKDSSGAIGSLHSLANGEAKFDNFLCSNIADLSVVFYAENHEGKPVALPTDLPFIYSDKLYSVGGVELADGNGNNYGSLLSAEIRIVVLSDKGAKEFAASSITGMSKDDIIRREGTIFTRRVPIMSRL